MSKPVETVPERSSIRATPLKSTIDMLRSSDIGTSGRARTRTRTPNSFHSIHGTVFCRYRYPIFFFLVSIKRGDFRQQRLRPSPVPLPWRRCCCSTLAVQGGYELSLELWEIFLLPWIAHCSVRPSGAWCPWNRPAATTTQRCILL